MTVVFLVVMSWISFKLGASYGRYNMKERILNQLSDMESRQLVEDITEET